ncbi:MAG TPA: SCO family protein [Vicinamibacterales bacterium]|jgi:protein SCO1/2|nr:SCO family protein [Vicinamibacterales bacterium]
MRRLLAALVLLAAVSACRSGPPPREFEIVGQIQAIAPEQSEVTIKHQDIKGFMPGMTMAFKAASGVLEGQRPGDLVTGTLVVGEVDVHISKLTVTGHRELDPTTVLPADGSAIIQPGDLVKDAALLDQDGKARRLSNWRGHRLALTFVYTRCPLPEFCPLINQHFRTVQATLAKTPALADVQLLSVTLDPAYDTPAVLKPFAAGAGADPKRWTFLTAEPVEAARFMEQFGILVERDPSNEVQITHNLRTAVIDADGRLKTVHTGNRWLPDELVADLAATPAPAH